MEEKEGGWKGKGGDAKENWLDGIEKGGMGKKKEGGGDWQ